MYYLISFIYLGKEYTCIEKHNEIEPIFNIKEIVLGPYRTREEVEYFVS